MLARRRTRAQVLVESPAQLQISSLWAALQHLEEGPPAPERS